VYYFIKTVIFELPGILNQTYRQPL